MTGDLDPKCGWKARAEDLSTSLVTVAQERDDAKTEAARLREVAADCEEWLRAAEGTEVNEYGAATAQREELCAALAATDSDEWLAKHDAEVRAPLEHRIAELNAKSARRENELLERVESETASLREQLIAATNDAARAELRARDMDDERKAMQKWCCENLSYGELLKFSADRKDLAAPDSDARLREVMMAVALRTMETFDETEAQHIIDEVLGVKP